MMKSASFFLLILLSLNSCKQKTTEEQVIKWVFSHAAPLSSVLPGSSSEDLSPLKDMVGDARIVALGEPTHGNREVFQLKHRMIEYMVTEMGFNLFALECPFGEAYDINRYVVEGIGDPEKALAGIYYWTWDTQEVLELIKWMRNYNANPAHKKKVKFYGFDPQDPERAAKVMLEYLEKVDPELLGLVRPELGILAVPFTNQDITGRRQFIPEEYDSLSVRDIRRVMMAFDKNKDRYINASSPFEYTLARQHARQVEWFIESNMDDGINYNKVRDLGQAENIQWILDQEGDEGKVIVWAHNSHVNNSSRKGYVLMGYHLRQWYGDQLKIFGFFFNQGGFKAMDEETPSRGMYDFSVGPAPDGTLENVMATSGLSVAALDMHELPDQGPVYNWFNEPQQTRYSWGGYIEHEPQNFFWPYKLAEEFDVLMFLDATTATKSIDNKDYDNITQLDNRLEKPLNLDFEENKPSEVPNGWVAWSKFQRLGVKMIVSDENPYQGNHAAMVHRSEDLTYGEIAPSLRQYIDATPYRGKTIRLHAAARAELKGSSFAYLRLAIDPSLHESIHNGYPPLFDSLDKYRLESTEWKMHEIEAEVPDNADVISYGIYLRDFGTVWLDAVEIEIVD